jgi:hypothetical protein
LVGLTQFQTENRYALFLELLRGISDMVGKLLLRGMLVGLVAGILAFAFARVYGEPQVDKAIAYEEQQAQAAGEAPEPEMVSRAVQSMAPLLAGCSRWSLLTLTAAWARSAHAAPRRCWRCSASWP